MHWAKEDWLQSKKMARHNRNARRR